MSLPVDHLGQPLRLTEVGGVWDRIKDKVATAIGNDADCRPEDVYADLIDKRASLLMNDDGFVVLKMTHCRAHDRADCLLWIMYGNVNGFLAKYQSYIVGMAKSGGAVRLKFYTRRTEGFEKLAPLGSRPTFTEFVLDL